MAEGEEDIEFIERQAEQQVERESRGPILLTGSADWGPNVFIQNAGMVTSGSINITNYIGSGGKTKKTKPTQPLTNSTEPANTQQFQHISERLGSRWKSLGRYLGWDNDFLDQLDTDNNTNQTERNFQMLQKWTQKLGDVANKAALARALSNSGLGKLADYLHDPCDS